MRRTLQKIFTTRFLNSKKVKIHGGNSQETN